MSGKPPILARGPHGEYLVKCDPETRERLAAAWYRVQKLGKELQMYRIAPHNDRVLTWGESAGARARGVTAAPYLPEIRVGEVVMNPAAATFETDPIGAIGRMKERCESASLHWKPTPRFKEPDEGRKGTEVGARIEGKTFVCRFKCDHAAFDWPPARAMHEKNCPKNPSPGDRFEDAKLEAAARARADKKKAEKAAKGDTPPVPPPTPKPKPRPRPAPKKVAESTPPPAAPQVLGGLPGTKPEPKWYACDGGDYKRRCNRKAEPGFTACRPCLDYTPPIGEQIAAATKEAVGAVRETVSMARGIFKAFMGW